MKVLRSPDAPAATTGGQNGAGQAASANPVANLAALLSQADEPAAPESDPSAAPPAEGDPESPPAPPAEGAPGEDTLPADQQPQAEGDESPAASGEQPEPDSNVESDNADLSKGAQKRIDDLTREKYRLRDELEQAQARVEELETAANAPATATQPGLSEPVQKLKSVDAVASRRDFVEGVLNEIQDALDGNPGDANTPIAIGDGKEMSRGQLIQKRAQFRDEMKQLGVRESQIRGADHLRATQKQFQSETRSKLPWLNDAEHPRTQQVRQVLREMPGLNNTPNPELWAAIVVEGQKVINTEIASRVKGNGTVLKKPAVVPGKVPTGKPHSSAGATPGGANGAGGIKSALDAHSKSGSRSSFAAVLAARNAP